MDECVFSLSLSLSDIADRKVQLFNRFNAPLMKRSNCHFASLAFWPWFWFWLWQFVASMPGNQRQPVNWKVSCNYKSFFIILWHFSSSSSSLLCVDAALVATTAVDILSLYAYNFGQVANVFLPQVARQSVVRVVATVTETDPAHVWPKFQMEMKMKMEME